MTKPKAKATPQPQDTPRPASTAAAVDAAIRPAGLQCPTFTEAARYRVLEKAFMSGIKIRHGNDWMPYDDVLLDPESQPLMQKLSGPFSGRGDAERVPIEIEFEGIPDYHLEPLNDAANWMMDHVEELETEARRVSMAQTRMRGRTRGRRNPIDALTVIGPGAEVLSPQRESV